MKFYILCILIGILLYLFDNNINRFSISGQKNEGEDCTYRLQPDFDGSYSDCNPSLRCQYGKCVNPCIDNNESNICKNTMCNNVNDPITTDPIDNGICSGKHCLDSSTIERLINGNIYIDPITRFSFPLQNVQQIPNCDCKLEGDDDGNRGIYADSCDWSELSDRQKTILRRIGYDYNSYYQDQVLVTFTQGQVEQLRDAGFSQAWINSHNRNVGGADAAGAAARFTTVDEG